MFEIFFEEVSVIIIKKNEVFFVDFDYVTIFRLCEFLKEIRRLKKKHDRVWSQSKRIKYFYRFVFFIFIVYNWLIYIVKKKRDDKIDWFYVRCERMSTFTFKTTFKRFLDQFVFKHYEHELSQCQCWEESRMWTI